MRRRHLPPFATAASARLAVMESHSRHKTLSWATPTAVAWLLFAVASLPWLFWGHATAAWSWVLVAVVLISLRVGGALVLQGVPVLAAVCAYGGAGSMPARPWQFGLALAAAGVAALLHAPRPQRLIAVVGVAASFFLVLQVLVRPPGQPEALRFVALSTGLACGCIMYMSLRCLLNLEFRQARLALSLILVAGTVAGVRGLLAKPEPAWALPAWRQHALFLEDAAPTSPSAATDEIWLALEALRTVGSRDAAHAWVGLALGQNADPQALRDACLRLGWEGALRGNWKRWMNQGEQACAAMRAWPEVGASALRGAAPALQRLGGDLLMEGGRVDAAMMAYAAASEAGDFFAAQDGQQALRLRHRASHAAGHMRDTLDFWTLAAPARAGVEMPTGPDELHSIYDPTLRRRVVVSRSPYGNDVTVRLPVPIGSAAFVVLTAKRRGILSLLLRDCMGGGTSYSCAPEASALPLPAALCAGEWAEAVLPLPACVSDILLFGNFALARFGAT